MNQGIPSGRFRRPPVSKTGTRRAIHSAGGEELGSVNELLPLGFAPSPGLFPMTPEGNVAEVERVPPGIEHGGVEAKDTFTGHSGRRRNERGKAVVYCGAVSAVDARQQVPEGEGVAGASRFTSGAGRHGGPAA